MVRVYRKDFLEGYEIGDDPNELKRMQEGGYTTSYDEALAGSESIGGQNYSGSTQTAEEAKVDAGDYSEGLERARALFKFMPEAVQKEFATQWVKFGETSLARAAVRNTQAWKDEFEYLERKDGSLIMSELIEWM